LGKTLNAGMADARYHPLLHRVPHPDEPERWGCIACRQFVHGYAEPCGERRDCESAPGEFGLPYHRWHRMLLPPRRFPPNNPLGTFGTANRRFFHGPGFNNAAFGFLKRTVIKESLAFE